MKTFRKSFIKKKPLEKASAKAQSAMEYLMTYGWAILIIAVVLGALFELGVFNANNFAPKAPPGACQVFRPNGPGTTSFINLEGVCTGEIPQYVAQFNMQTGQYIAYSGSLNIPNVNPITIAAWINYKGGYFPPGIPAGIAGIKWGCSFEQFTVYSGWLFLNDCGTDGGNFWSNLAVPSNKWVFVAYTLNGNTLIFYENGASDTITTSGTYQITPTALDIGTDGVSSNEPSFNGSISNVQIYNTSLSANDIQALYLEGIGGAPIDLQNLVAWYPLDGNANDYSGNDNNGVPTNVIFVSNWYSGYTPP